MIFSKFVRHIGALFILFIGSQSVLASSSTFISITDVHFDPFATCTEVTPCPLIQRLEEAPASNWHDILVSADTAMPHFGQDTNTVLLQSTLKALQKTAQQTHPQFIIMLGDVLAHRYLDKYQKYSAHPSPQGYQDFVKKTMVYMVSELQTQFPNTDVYMLVGNNDSYQGNYSSDTKSVFFHDMAGVWGPLIKNQTNRSQMQSDFTSGGYYALDISEQPALRLLVLNSVLFSPHAAVNTAAINSEFEWFEQQLQLARLHNKHVLIAMHIPAGIDIFAMFKQTPQQIVEMWVPEYTQRFTKDLAEYADNIVGILTGHTHTDSFQIIKTPKGAKIPVSSTPSISPLNGNNPGWKVFSYDTQTAQLQDFSTFYAPLATLIWQQEYDFNTVYQSNQLQPLLLTGFELLTRQGKLANDYQLYYDTSANTDPIHHSYNPYYWCQISAITAADYVNCLAGQ